MLFFLINFKQSADKSIRYKETYTNIWRLDLLKKNIFNKILKLKTKGFTAFIFLIGATCLFFFMNCANEEPIIIESSSQSTPSTGLLVNNTPFPTLPTSNSNTANTNNCPTPPLPQLSIIQQVAAETDNLYKTDVSLFTQNVVECLKDISPNWGVD